MARRRLGHQITQLGVYVFLSCKQFIRTFPCLVYSSTDVEDIDTDGEDHIYDEFRYVCMERPISAPKVNERPLIISGYDPLELNNTAREGYKIRARFG